MVKIAAKTVSKIQRSVRRRVSPSPGSWRVRGFLLLTEAAVTMAAVRFLVKFTTFRTTVSVASQRVRRTAPDGLSRDQTIRDVRWAVRACSRRAPFRALCLEEGLTAQQMLRRRGIPATLYYGAALDGPSGLHAHVWVRAGDADVIGTEVAGDFAILAQLPATSTLSSDRSSQ
jgi:hypothetical protein